MKHPDFIPLVQNLWNKPCYAESALDRIQLKLKKFKQYFKGWGHNKLGEQKKKRKLLQDELAVLEELDEDNLLSLDQTQSKAKIQSEILKMLEDEELYWFKRSHSTWLHMGDNNTEFFHRIANGRKRKNTIIYLSDGINKIEGDDNLITHATNFYKDLFGPAPGDSFPLRNDL